MLQPGCPPSGKHRVGAKPEPGRRVRGLFRASVYPKWARGDAHVNTAESFFSLIKRGIYGVYHNVSKKHLHRYVTEFEFRFTGRKLEDDERTAAAIRGAVGKRLFYRERAA